MRWCDFIKNPDAVEECRDLKKLVFSLCRNLVSLPNLTHLQKLESVEFYSCNQLREMPRVYEGVRIIANKLQQLRDAMIVHGQM